MLVDSHLGHGSDSVTFGGGHVLMGLWARASFRSVDSDDILRGVCEQTNV